MIIWGRVLLCCYWCQFVPEIGLPAVQYFRVYCKVQPKSGTKVCSPQLVSLFLCLGIGHRLAATSSFVPGEVVLSFPNTLQGNCFSLCNPVDPQTTLLILGLYPPSPQKSGTTLVVAWISEVSNSVLCHS